MQLTAGLPAACRDRERRLLADLLAAELALARRLGPGETFQAGAPRPDLVPRVKREMARLLDLTERPFPFRIECPANSCSVSAEGELDPPLTNYWDCLPPGEGQPQRCKPHPAHGSYRLLERRNRSRSGIIERTVPPSRNDSQERPAYLVVRLDQDRGTDRIGTPSVA